LSISVQLKEGQQRPQKPAPAAGLTEDNWSKADLNDPLGF
jgi:hypothetical protein